MNKTNFFPALALLGSVASSAAIAETKQTDISARIVLDNACTADGALFIVEFQPYVTIWGDYAKDHIYATAIPKIEETLSETEASIRSMISRLSITDDVIPQYLEHADTPGFVAEEEITILSDLQIEFLESSAIIKASLKEAFPNAAEIQVSIGAITEVDWKGAPHLMCQPI